MCWGLNPRTVRPPAIQKNGPTGGTLALIACCTKGSRRIQDFESR